MIRFACSNCDEEMEISDRMAGKKIECVECGARVRVPEIEEEESPRRRREAEPPPKRRSDIVEGEPPRQRREGEEETPPRRRSEIVEGEPPSRTETEYDDEPPPRKKKKKRGGLRRADLRQVAIYQKAIILCILAYIIVAIVSSVLWQAGFPPLARLPLGLVALAAFITGAVFVFMMAIKLYSVGVSVVLGIITLIPIVGLIVLLVINGKATAALRYGGYKVGLLGVPLWQFDE